MIKTRGYSKDVKLLTGSQVFQMFAGNGNRQSFVKQGVKDEEFIVQLNFTILNFKFLNSHFVLKNHDKMLM